MSVDVAGVFIVFIDIIIFSQYVVKNTDDGWMDAMSPPASQPAINRSTMKDIL